MIYSFACKETEKIFNRKPSKTFPSDIHKRSKCKLDMINAAEEIYLTLKAPQVID